VTVKLNEPAAVGMPCNVPVELKVMPAGSASPVIANV
jgi:hypothetical protein